MKPILFNTDMVRAILEGRKTVTRRVIKDKDIINAWDCESDGTPIAFIDQETGDSHPPAFPCQYQQGDILYVRETFTYVPGGSCVYKASVECPDAWKGTWHPSIHMPKEAARLFLRVTDVRAERLRDMTIEDFQKEGIKREEAHARGCHCQWATETCREEPCSNRDAYEYLCWAPQFRKMWDSTVDPFYLDLYAWSANPWVWVISFERISMEEALK